MNKDQKRKAYKAMEEWGYNEKLEDSGFYDLEGGVDGHLLKGPASISLFSLANRSSSDHGLRHDSALRAFQDVADDTNADLSFAIGGKARYYHFAALLACQAYREGFPWDLCHVWNLHAQGHGERVISRLVGVSRRRVRKHLEHLRLNIAERLDTDE